MKALAIWRMYPRQIASDLRRFWPGCHIRDWHQGRMSSYELIELFGASVTDDPETETRTIRIDFAPEDGAVADALRGGERPEWKQAVVQTASISALFRSAKFPDADTSEYGEQLFLSIDRIREIEAEQHAREVERRRNQQSDIPEPGGLYSLWQAEEVI
jgi:hypothetical protein